LKNLSNLTQRIITAVIGVIIVLAGLFYSEWSFLALFCLLGVFSQMEFYKLVKLDDKLPLRIYGTFCGVILNVLLFLSERNELKASSLYVMLPLISLIFFIKLYKKEEEPFTNIAYTFLGLIYVSLPFALVHVISMATGSFEPKLVLGCLIILWASDSGAYITGRSFGKRKLFERISPKKTWEGFIGGAIFALVAAFIQGQYFVMLPLNKWLIVAVIIVITGTYGDLVESQFKRSIDIKDSGSIIPGHGGFLDRFDGLLLSIPFIVAFLKIFN
jgi:phosphatidate cytidylyltransferase